MKEGAADVWKGGKHSASCERLALYGKSRLQIWIEVWAPALDLTGNLACGTRGPGRFAARSRWGTKVPRTHAPDSRGGCGAARRLPWVLAAA